MGLTASILRSEKYDEDPLCRPLKKPMSREVKKMVLAQMRAHAGLVKDSENDFVHGQIKERSDAKEEFFDMSSFEREIEAEEDMIEQLQEMLNWETEADVQKAVLTEKLIKLLRHPEHIIVDDEQDKLWLFYRLIEELAWVDLDRAFDFYMEWARQNSDLQDCDLDNTEVLKHNSAESVEVVKENRKLKWDDRMLALTPGSVIYPDIC